MGQIFKIHEVERDPELGIVKKQVSSTKVNFQFETPVATQKSGNQDPNRHSVKINEIAKQIDSDTLISFASNGITPFIKQIEEQRLQGKLNTTIFNLKFDSVPDDRGLRLLAHALHSSSKDVMFLPTVKTSFLQELFPGRRKPSSLHPEFTNKKIRKYLQMMDAIIEEAKSFGNGQEIVGTIPFIPFGFAEPIIDFYFSKGIRTFAIDANYKDIMGNRADFTPLISKIKQLLNGLDETLIFACNAGIPHFQADEAISNDFLSVFAYVDILGGASKQRVVTGEPRAKIFSRDRYSYNLTTYTDVSRSFGRSMNPTSLKYFNRLEQLKETQTVRDLVGIEKMKKFLGTKQAIDQKSIKYLEDIAKKIGPP
jgi:hypothetical protein